MYMCIHILLIGIPDAGSGAPAKGAQDFELRICNSEVVVNNNNNYV